MKKSFSKTTNPSYEAGKRALNKLKIPYKEQSNGTLLVEEDINLSHKGLKKLPDLSCVILTENFNCSYNELTSLEGAPQSVGKSFFGNNNALISLEGAPQYVGWYFWCQDNHLTSLEGAPQSVGDSFCCQDNHLTSLKGAPLSVERGFWCYNNQLTTLEGAPKNFKRLLSNFGSFSSWYSIPKKLRASSETKAKHEQTQKHKAIKKEIHTEQYIPCKPPLKVIRKKRNIKKPNAYKP